MVGVGGDKNTLNFTNWMRRGLDGITPISSATLTNKSNARWDGAREICT